LRKRERELEKVDEKKKEGTNKCMVNQNAIFVKRFVCCLLEMNMKVKDKFVRYEVATLSNYMHGNLNQSIYKNLIKIIK
jgi:hypothetical protein